LALGEKLDLKRKEPCDDITFEKFAWRWYDQYVKTNNKPSEQYAKENILRSNLIPFFGPMRINEITAERIQQFAAKQKVTKISPKTINNRLTVLGKCLKCANEWLEIPLPRIKLLKAQPPRTDYLTPEDCKLLLDHADGQLRTMLILALRSGMRQGEIRGLQWTSIDWQNRIITVRHSWDDTSHSLGSPKNNRERHIPLDQELFKLLGSIKQKTGFVFLSPYRKPYTRNRFIDDLAKICKKAGIRKIGWHALRHTFATQLVMRGAPLTAVKELLGHSSITTTMRYAHTAPSTLRAAIDLLNPRTVLSADFGHQMGTQWQQVICSDIFKIDRP